MNFKNYRYLVISPIPRQIRLPLCFMFCAIFCLSFTYNTLSMFLIYLQKLLHELVVCIALYLLEGSNLYSMKCIFLQLINALHILRDEEREITKR